MAGIRSSLTRTFAILNPSSPSVINVLSTYPNCPFFGNTEESSETSGLDRLVCILPINTFFSSNIVFSFIKPFSSRSE